MNQVTNAMSRREMLRTGTLVAGGALAATLGSPRASLAADEPPASKRRTLRKAVMIGMVGEGATLLEKFRIVRECGFDGIEMDSPTDLKMEQILEAQEKTGLKVHGVVDGVHWQYHLNSPDEATREKGVKALEQAIRDAKAMGGANVLLVPAVVNAKQSYDQAWTLSMAAIRRVLPLAAECGVTVSVENVWNNFLLSPLEAARYVDELAHPNAAFYFDVGNIINVGFPDQWIRVLGPRMARLHIKDFSRKKRDDLGLWKGFDVELGDGDANWTAVMKALDDIGYSTAPEGRWATAEVGGGDRKRLAFLAERMDKLFAM
jgi:L-ribulose-5-phosphate 3-epimerase